MQRVRANTLNPLIPRLASYFDDPEHFLLKGSGEKKFLKHIKEGGVAAILIDLPIEKKSGGTVKYFGHPLKLSNFPFRIALKHKIPILFALFEKNDIGGYSLRLTRAEVFKAPEDGLAAYVKLLEEKVKADPFMWGGAPHFFDWVDDFNGQKVTSGQPLSEKTLRSKEVKTRGKPLSK